MGKTLTTRISDKLEEEVEEISKEESLDKSTTARKLLKKSVEEYKLDKALEKYKKGEISLGKAAELAGVSIRKILFEIKKRDIHFHYSKESLNEDFGALINE